MEEKLFDGKKIVAATILPQNEYDGFFVVREFDARGPIGDGGSEPLIAKALTLELTNGETLRLVVQRKKAAIIGGIEWALAKTLKGLVDGKSDLIRVDESGVRHILYKDLADAFNAEHPDEHGAPGDLKAQTAGMICRDMLDLPIHRTPVGYAIFLEEAKLAAMVERYELGV